MREKNGEGHGFKEQFSMQILEYGAQLYATEELGCDFTPGSMRAEAFWYDEVGLYNLFQNSELKILSQPNQPLNL